MIDKIKVTLFSVCIFIMFNDVLSLAVADADPKEMKGYQKRLDHDDDDQGKHRERNGIGHGEDDHTQNHLGKVNHPIYEEECGACHFVYQPQLLPSASWIRILANLEDHFGEMIELDENSRKAIAGYLKTNSAEYSSAKYAVKIMRSLRNQVPLRITDIPYILEKHDEISPNILKQEAIGSLSNCAACHTTATTGIYEDDNVKIPK